MVVLEARNLKKVYNKDIWTKIGNIGRRIRFQGVKTVKTAVDDVSFYVRRGEVVGLMGANGAGKTTSFRMVCGLIVPDGGSVYLKGKEITHWPMHERVKAGMGYLPQDRSTFDSLTVKDNIYAAAEFLFKSRKEMDKKCKEIIERFRLEEKLHQKVGSGGTGGLSGGERRRLEIARAMLADPDILLLDEPFANVDPKTVGDIIKEIKKLARESNVGILITDHEVNDMVEIADRIYVINKGKVICDGTPPEVLTDPKAKDSYFARKAEQALMVWNKREKEQRSAVPNSSAEDRGSSVSRAPFSGPSRSEFAREEQNAPTPSRLVQRQPYGNGGWGGGSQLSSPARREPKQSESVNNGFRASMSESTRTRPTLSLGGRETGAPRRTPTPRDSMSEPNRYSDKISEQFRRAKDWEDE